MALYECTGCGRRNKLSPDGLCLNCAIEGPEKVRERLAQIEPESIPSIWQQQKELGYIVSVENLSSIFQLGILSHTRANRVSHLSLANEKVQDRRDQRTVGHRPLHEYVNLYFNPRNAMLYDVLCHFVNVTVLMVDAATILNRYGVWLSNRNASASRAGFFRSPSGLDKLDYVAIHSHRWRHDGYVDMATKQAMQSEVLVPDMVPSSCFTRILVPDRSLAQEVRRRVPTVSAVIDSEMFFE